ncbi:UNVERIFIED_CONTAM: hypothetical protein FKN15_064144 [Acipenser sinensis]
MTRTLRSMAVLLFLAVSINAASINAAPLNKKMFLEEIIDILQKKSQCSTEKVALVSFTDCKASCKVNKEVEIELRDFLKDLKRCARQQYRHI